MSIVGLAACVMVAVGFKAKWSAAFLVVMLSVFNVFINKNGRSFMTQGECMPSCFLCGDVLTVYHPGGLLYFPGDSDEASLRWLVLRSG